MPVNLEAPQQLLPVAGVRVGTASLGQRKQPRHDLTVMWFNEGASVAATFTRNAMCAAPVTVARRHLSTSSPRALVINAGNANAGTGEPGIRAAQSCCDEVAKILSCASDEVLPFSTGVIGEPLDPKVLAAALPALQASFDEDGWMAASNAILTTDIVAKGISRTIEIAGKTVTITGIAKGSGMIRPDMATMLAFIATDACVDAACLQHLLSRSIEQSFNRITVDSDTSTNDACVLIATAAANHGVIESEHSEGFDALASAIDDVCLHLAHAIVRDGEGATKFVAIQVSGGKNVRECLDTAFTVAHSPLVKTALYASDANWGRILAAVGRAGIDALDIERVNIWLGDVQIVRGGARADEYTEQAGSRVMADEEIAIHIALGRGDVSETVWTCDFSHQYVTINAEYRS